MRVVAVIPALDEEACVGDVVSGLVGAAGHVVVVDNGSRDRTAERARQAGAVVVARPERGYGRACLAGVERARSLGAEVLLFLDADGSDDPRDAPKLLAPVVSGEADLVLGVRPSRLIERGAMTGTQRFGNWLAPLAMRLAAGARFSDMPPYKAITLAAFDALGVQDRTYGFTIELLLRAHRRRLRVREIPVACRARRGGHSKVSGTLRGTLGASYKILSTIARYRSV